MAGANAVTFTFEKLQKNEYFQNEHLIHVQTLQALQRFVRQHLSKGLLLATASPNIALCYLIFPYIDINISHCCPELKGLNYKIMSNSRATLPNVAQNRLMLLNT